MSWGLRMRWWRGEGGKCVVLRSGERRVVVAGGEGDEGTRGRGNAERCKARVLREVVVNWLE